MPVSKACDFLLLPAISPGSDPHIPKCYAKREVSYWVPSEGEFGHSCKHLNLSRFACVKSGSDPRGTPNADGSGVRKGGVRGAELNTGVVFGWGVRGGMGMDARIHLRVDKHAGGP